MRYLFDHEIDASRPSSLGDQICILLRNEIRAGRWREGERLPTVRELARASGLSSSPISQAMAKLVREGFLVRHVGRGTFLRSMEPDSRRRSGVVGIVYNGAAPGQKTTASEAFDRELIMAVAELLSDGGYSVQLFHEDALAIEGWKTEQIIATSPFKNLAALLNIGPVGDAVLFHVQGVGVPVVCLGDPHPPPDVPFVAGGIQQAVWESLDILYRAGHRRIGLVHTTSGLPKRTRRLRYEAFFGACAELGLHPPEHWIADIGPRFNVNVGLVRRFLSDGDVPTAVVCTHNHAAQTLYEVAALTETRIPDDLSVLLITSQSDFGEDFEPALSTLVIPMKPYAARAVELLTEMLADGSPQSHGGTLIRPVRRLRESIGIPAVLSPPQASEAMAHSTNAAKSGEDL